MAKRIAKMGGAGIGWRRMTSRVILLALALAGVGWTLLGVVRTPTWLSWKLGLVAGEFGHWLSVGMLVVAVLGFWLASSAEGGARVVAAGAFGVALMATGLALRPAAGAARIARTLPTELATSFGGEPAGRAFSWSRLWSVQSSPAVGVETRVFAQAGTADELAMDVYRPNGDAPRPVVIVIHGGGWDNGDRFQLTAFNHQVARMGYVVVAISYRLAPAHVWPAQRDDVLAAITHLKTHAAELSIDATKIVLLGRSAGGQIASAVGYGADDPAVVGVVGLYSPHDLNFAWRYAREDDALNSVKLMRQYLGGGGAEVPARYDEASGIRFVKRRVAADPRPTPPTLLFHGTIDTLVWRRQSERLATVLAVNDVPHVFVELPWAVHAFDFNPHGPAGQLLDYALRHFLRQVTNPGPASE